MKRFLLILIILTFVLCVFTSCNTTNSCNVGSTVSPTTTATPEEKSIPDETASVDVEQESITIGMGTYAEPESIEKIIIKSYSIVKGTLVNVEQDAKINNKKHYTFKVDEYIKGKLDDMDEVVFTMFDFEANINCTMCENTYQNGDKFILPLIKNQDIYRGDSYQLAGSMLVLLDKENIKDIYHQSRIYAKQKPETVEAFKSIVSKTVEDTKQNGEARGASYTISDDINEIVEFSEVIVKASIKEDSFYKWNDKLCSYKLEILEVLKGEVPKEIAVYALIEDNLVMGDEYLMLLSKPDYKVAERYNFSSYYSCISINDTKKCEEYIKYINNKQ